MVNYSNITSWDNFTQINAIGSGSSDPCNVAAVELYVIKVKVSIAFDFHQSSLLLVYYCTRIAKNNHALHIGLNHTAYIC